ncbi:Uncharacterised protein [Mycobacterium tuberculosis]|nr:Uncharacterised protein [Mycobacterium tuberculosis]
MCRTTPNTLRRFRSEGDRRASGFRAQSRYPHWTLDGNQALWMRAFNPAGLSRSFNTAGVSRPFNTAGVSRPFNAVRPSSRR